MGFTLVAGGVYSLVAVLGLMVVASLVGTGSWVCGLGSCGSRAPEHRLSDRGTWA